MTILLKIILFLFSAGSGYVLWYMFKDFKSARNTNEFDELSPWNKLQLSTIFALVLMGIASFIILLLYFVVLAEIPA
jgi:hypothetical protein